MQNVINQTHGMIKSVVRAPLTNKGPLDSFVQALRLLIDTISMYQAQ